jgi:hypothetical protein
VRTSLLAWLEAAVEGQHTLFWGRNAKLQFGFEVYRLCDRGPQEEDFALFFRQKMRDAPFIPQIYILRGEERENLDSLIDRFCRVTIEKHLIPQLNLPCNAVTCRRVKWPDSNSSAPEEAVKLRLFENVAEDEDYPTLDSATLVKMRLLSASGILALKHEIRETRWSTKVLRLIDWYCSFWDEVASHRPMCRLLVFISILYPDGTREDGLKSLLPFSLAFGPVERDLNELQNRRKAETAENSYMCPIARLQEVRCIRAKHLMDWFSDFKVCELRERVRYRNQLFAGRKCIHMAHLEPELEKIVNKWRNKRL